MKTRFLLPLVLACGQVLAQQASPPAAGGQEGNGRAPCESSSEASTGAHCAARDEAASAPADPGKLVATEPTGAGPRSAALTRRQVIAEIERARRSGEMDFAAFEANLDSPRRR